MFYVIEAVRWGRHGHITHVRWHGVEAGEQGVRRTSPQVVPVVDAAEVCRNAEVRVLVDGDPSRFFRMKACPEGIDAVADEAGTPLRERLSHLPQF